MTARLVFVCDVCGAVTDDHYAHPVNDARFRARATGWTYRRKSSGGHHNQPGPDRLWVDLCPEHTYELGLAQAPLKNATWLLRKEPVALRSPKPDPATEYGARVTYSAGDGPYRLYTQLVSELRSAGAGRGTTEQLRREMFAPGADFLSVARTWATVETEEEDGNEERAASGPGG